MAVSVFDLFKIGIGPSSSHTVGPMRAARLFMARLVHDGLLPERTARVRADLYGSLGATGKGHGSDKAVLLGLAGQEPDTVDVDQVPAELEAMRSTKTVALSGTHRIAFDEATDLVMHRRETLPFHSNGMRFTAFDAGGAEIANRRLLLGRRRLRRRAKRSRPTARSRRRSRPTRPCCRTRSAAAPSCCSLTGEFDCSIAEIMRRNERHWRTRCRGARGAG